MPIASVADLVACLRQLPLLEPEQMEEVLSLQDHFPTARTFARELLKRNLLTPYQINQMFQGHGQDLILGSYRIAERLGEGGMGRVFKAYHSKLNRKVALKVLHKEYLEREHAINRFYQEIQVAAQLTHPNVVFAFDADHVHDIYFLAMEYVDGIGLARLVDQTGPLPADQACDYMHQAALGLQHAHEQGLVHRDIKPSNLLVTRKRKARALAAAAFGEKHGMAKYPHGVVKIIDFGLARLQRPDAPTPPSGRRLTRLGTVMGTPDFIAPEQASNTQSADTRSDLYSLGCTFYYLLTGRLPFPRGSMMEKLKQHETKEPIKIEKVSPDVPTELANVVRKLMAKQPELRYQTPGDLANELSTFLRPGTKRAKKLKEASKKHERDVFADLQLPGFFGPGAGSLSSTTIFTV
jgi:serine/threonine-protein kinase